MLRIHLKIPGLLNFSLVLKLLSNYLIVIFDDNIQNSSACEVIKDETRMYDKIKYK